MRPTGWVWPNASTASEVPPSASYVHREGLLKILATLRNQGYKRPEGSGVVEGAVQTAVTLDNFVDERRYFVFLRYVYDPIESVGPGFADSPQGLFVLCFPAASDYYGGAFLGHLNSCGPSDAGAGSGY